MELTIYVGRERPREVLGQFREVRDAMNHTLDRELWFRFNDQPMTYRMLFEGMIYTRFAHASRGKHALFDQMATHPFGLAMAMSDFLKCVCVVHAALVIINKLNAAAFCSSTPIHDDPV